MGLLAWIFVGLIAGAVAKAVYAGKDPGGFIHFLTILIGIGGAIVGGFVSTLFGFGAIYSLDIRNLLIAILGAGLLLFFYQKFSTRRAEDS
ncbi:GlsB/YeaQ/YmgE family stress response membrane protein [Rhabdobacter roseus]|uniref:Putative membrane protein YeaQ/YmgE (Transglycosylase-associated protein family) n=1 Tax=Rhabdobacter roseus TaxID=1655419 RepID=A0A840TWN6_9BACT|nr:GlsB/YeaQ/YmgE family stress response membrane protein [Rhabdobacter roseus]MBB5287345.1 putative membrane protein YeaQ/YmgE (transglycosylase-associated protein family) [Rhabdobacter roseus]